MKNILPISLLTLALIPGFIPTPLHAQGAVQQPGGLQTMSPDQVVDLIDSKLHLSADQRAQIEPIIAERRQQLIALRDDTSTMRFRKARKMKSIFAESDRKIEALLDDQQKQQYVQISEQLKQTIRQRVQSGDVGEDTPR